MGSVIPTKDLEAIQFFETHVPVWSAAHADVGLSDLQCNSMLAATKASRDAYAAQQAAKDAATAATTGYHNAVKAMRALGSDLVKAIKTYAATSNNPDVYMKAEIPMPAAPSPLPPPGQPTDFKIGLTGSGAVELTWKCANATASSGVHFVVTRKLNGGAGESTFTTVGNIGKKKFTDATIPQGVTGATYLVQGFRVDNPGPVSLPVGVQFGVSGNMVVGPQLKMAA
jgi:hypothetical protein